MEVTVSYMLKANYLESEKSIIGHFFKLPGELQTLFSLGGKLPPERAPSLPKLERGLRKLDTDKCWKQMMGTWAEGTDWEKTEELPEALGEAGKQAFSKPKQSRTSGQFLSRRGWF